MTDTPARRRTHPETHLDPRCRCTHAAGYPCDMTCPLMFPETPVVPLIHAESTTADRILVAADWARYDLDRGILDGEALYENAYLMPSISRHNPRQAHLGMGDYITAAAIREATIGEAPGAAVPVERLIDCYGQDRS